KILAVTCNNASANDMMTDELEFDIPEFEGKTSRIWCILHVGNLVVKMMIKQFDVPKNQEIKALGAE
ncbi:hypothetical protein EDC04DRAFT_2499093, partial [Pisolithus marmoratus]